MFYWGFISKFTLKNFQEHIQRQKILIQIRPDVHVSGKDQQQTT